MDEDLIALAKRFEEVGDCAASIPDLLHEQASRHPERDFLVFEQRSATYSDFDETVRRLATGLARAGVKPGDRVAFQCESRLEMAEIVFAVWRLGAIGVPLNIFLRGKPLEHQLNDSGSSTLVVDADGYATAVGMRELLPQLTRLVLLDDVAVADEATGIDTYRLDELRASEIDDFPARAITDPALIMYTSGTTGLPKGCVLSFRYLHHVGREWIAFLELGKNDVLLTAAPLYHFGGFILVMTALVAGLTIAVETKFSASRYFQRVAEVGATHTIGVGWLVVALLAQPERDSDRTHSLRVMQATPVSEEDRERFEERFGTQLVSEVFGQTEVTLPTVSTVDGKRRPGSAGRPAPWYDVAILDELDRVAPRGEVGEIVVRPKVPGSMYDGYWGRPDETVAVSSNYWHHTGDLGRMDDEDFLFFVDRKSDRLRRRGENVGSFEVESVITSHSAIVEAAVFAVSVPGEVDDTIKASLVLTPGTAITPQEIAEFFATQLPYYAAPRFVEILPELPRNAVGRVMKSQLRQSAHAQDVWDLEQLDLGVSRDKRRR